MDVATRPAKERIRSRIGPRSSPAGPVDAWPNLILPTTLPILYLHTTSRSDHQSIEDPHPCNP